MSKFPYLVIPGKDRDVYKPWISVNLDFPKTHKVTPLIWALIDSGADNCLASWEIGLWLGIKFKKQAIKTFTAANGQPFTGFQEKVRMFFSGEESFCDFYFSKSIPVKAPIILGQSGFFDRHKVIFNLPEKELEII